MMYIPIIASAFISISSNIDNIGVGLAYGIRGVRIPFISNILIATITGIGTFISMAAGNRIGNFFGGGSSNIISGLLLIIIGFVSFLQRSEGFYNRKFARWVMSSNVVQNIGIFRKFVGVIDNPLLADHDESGHIDIFESIILALTLAVNNIANGIAAGLAGLSIYITTFLVIFFSVVSIWMGVGAGIKCRAFWISKNAAKISGIILVCIGLSEIFS